MSAHIGIGVDRQGGSVEHRGTDCMLICCLGSLIRPVSFTCSLYFVSVSFLLSLFDILRM